MKRTLSRFKPMRCVYTPLIVCVLLLFCGLTAFAAEEGSADLPQTDPPPAATATPLPSTTATPLPTSPEDRKDEIFPADVQIIVDGGGQQIIKTYILTTAQSPADIPRDGFERDGWRYTLTDITEKRVSGTDTRSYTETMEINTDSNDLNNIIKQLSPTLEYESEDGYCGLLTLDLASVKCEAAGYTNSSYTVTATREYPHLSTNDLSLIPKTITENGRTLELDGVSWEAQHTVNVDYEDIPDSYRAVARYTAKASKSVVTGYITTAEYSGEIAKAVTGDTVYAAYFLGKEINPTPKPTATPAPTATPTPVKEQSPTPVVPLIIGVAILAALLAGGGVFFFLRHNVKVYIIGDSGRVLVAKVRISVNSPTINLTPLSGRAESKCFGLEIDRLAAKSLNGRTVEVIFGPARLKHQIAYEGNTYKIETDFRDGTVKAIH